MTAAFDQALRAEHSGLELDTGERHTLAIRRWLGEPDAVDGLMLDRCVGPTLDIGCGPGRMTTSLLRRGALALGVDTSAIAVRMTTERGGLALHRSVFDLVPSEGIWQHALLVDGNLGIGGDPVGLLERVRMLLCRRGSALVELSPPGTGAYSGCARIGNGGWFPWARVGADAIEALAAAASFGVAWIEHKDGRWLAELVSREGTPAAQRSQE